VRARAKRCRKQAWQRAFDSIRRWGPVMGSRQAVQVGGVGGGGGIEVGLMMELFFLSPWARDCQLPMIEDIFWCRGVAWSMRVVFYRKPSVHRCDSLRDVCEPESSEDPTIRCCMSAA
jgi:hypothetical protein